MFTVAAKHKPAKNVTNQAGMFVTCNNMPEFEVNEKENINVRLAIFETREMPVKNSEAPAWINKNAMECLWWVACELNRNVELIDAAERFYEKKHDEFVKFVDVGAIPFKEFSKLQQNSNFSLQDININESVEVDDFEISHEFIGECSAGKFTIP